MRLVGTVERVRAPSRSAFEAYVRAGTPVILQGAVEGWPALERWSPSYLAELMGDVIVRCKRSTSNAHPDFRCGDWRRAFATEAMPFRTFLQRISTGSPQSRTRWLFTGDEQYVSRVREGEEQHNEALQPLTRDFGLPALVPRERLYSVWAWFSAAGVRTWLHYDNNGCHNLNMQVHGRKLCTLFSPDLLEGLDFFPIGGNNPALNCSRLDVETAEVDAYIQTLERYETELEAGDCLFIPAHYIHTVRHLGEYNANLNFWWKPELTEQDPSASENPVVRREAEIRGLSAELAAP